MIVTSSSVSVPPFVSHRTSVRDAGLAGGAQRRERVVAIGLVAVEEVLGVVDRLATAIDDEADRVGDHVEVLGRRRAQDLDDVEQPALAEDRHDRRLGGDQLAQVRVVARAGSSDGGSTRTRPASRRSQRIVRAAAKNSMSLGFEPGQPPSMKGIPNSSSIRATRSLSASDRVMFSPCVPSRRVVS